MTLGPQDDPEMTLTARIVWRPWARALLRCGLPGTAVLLLALRLCPTRHYRAIYRLEVVG